MLHCCVMITCKIFVDGFECLLVLLLSRLTLACGGTAMNSFDDLVPECLGEAGVVYEHVLVSQLQWSEEWRGVWDAGWMGEWTKGWMGGWDGEWMGGWSGVKSGREGRVVVLYD